MDKVKLVYREIYSYIFNGSYQQRNYQELRNKKLAALGRWRIV